MSSENSVVIFQTQFDNFKMVARFTENPALISCVAASRNILTERIYRVLRDPNS